MVDNHRLVLGSNHTQQGANQCSTLQANYRHLSVVGLLSRDIDLISAALFKLIVIIDTKFSPIFFYSSHVLIMSFPNSSFLCNISNSSIISITKSQSFVPTALFNLIIISLIVKIFLQLLIVFISIW